METLFIGKNIIFLPETSSTNSYATDLLKNVNLPEGTVVHTDKQTHGKGQRGSSWNAEPLSNLTASVILKPFFLNIKNQFYLYQICALACYDALSELLESSQFDIKIKWPNDILVNKKKIAGILIENTIQNNLINSCVAGFGINVNQQNFEGLTTATSLYLVTGQVFKIDQVLNLLCNHLEKHYLALKTNKLDFINSNYRSRFFGLNTWMNFEMNGSHHQMYVRGCSKNGLLLLENTSGLTLELDVKEVKWVY